MAKRAPVADYVRDHASYKGSHRAYVCEHGVVQSTCRCMGPKDEILVSCGTDCPGRAKWKGRKRG